MGMRIKGSKNGKGKWMQWAKHTKGKMIQWAKQLGKNSVVLIRAERLATRASALKALVAALKSKLTSLQEGSKRHTKVASRLWKAQGKLAKVSAIVARLTSQPQQQQQQQQPPGDGIGAVQPSSSTALPFKRLRRLAKVSCTLLLALVALLIVVAFCRGAWRVTCTAAPEAGLHATSNAVVPPAVHVVAKPVADDE